MIITDFFNLKRDYLKKIFLATVFGLLIHGFVIAYGQSDIGNDIATTNRSTPTNFFEYIATQYESGIKFRDAIPVAIGILAFSYFIWKTSNFLSKREVFAQKIKYTTGGTQSSFRKNRIFYVIKYVVIFPIIMYGWVVICFLFMWTLNTSLSFDILTLIMIGIVSASRIAAHWNEKLAEDIMKFLPFNLLFTFLLNPNVDSDKIFDAIRSFPPVMLELTIFIVFIGILEGILKIIYFVVNKSRRSSSDGVPIHDKS